MPGIRGMTAPPIPVTDPPSGGSARPFIYLLVAVAFLSALPWLPPLRAWLASSIDVLPAFGVIERGSHGILVPLIGLGIQLLCGAIAATVNSPLVRRAFPLRTTAAREVVERQSRRMRFVKNFGFTIALLPSPILIEASLSSAVLSRRAALTKEAMEPLATALLHASQDHALPKSDLNELVPARIDRIPRPAGSFAGPARALLGSGSGSREATRACVGFAVSVGLRRGLTRVGGAWLVFLLGRPMEIDIHDADFATWVRVGSDAQWTTWTDLGENSAAEARGSWSLVEQG